MSIQYFLSLADTVVRQKEQISKSDIDKMVQLADDQVFQLFAGATLIREHYFQNKIHLCVICNGKSGKCSEDCVFCAQSKYYQSEIDTYPLLSEEKLMRPAKEIKGTPVNRYAIVTSGKGLTEPEIDKVCKAYKGLNEVDLSLCASLGIIDQAAFKKLADAGVTRYHHNLETARSLFDQICTTHTYDQRLETIREAQKVGLSICSGGIFGMGETDAQVVEMALTLKRLDVDAVPLNFLSPIPGTPMEGHNELTPLRCLKIIALFRYLLPDKQILVCGGRKVNLGELHPFIFQAGASGIMTGNYLTTDGQLLESDLSMLESLGLVPDK